MFDIEVMIAGCDEEVCMIIFGDEGEIQGMQTEIQLHKQVGNDHVQVVIIFQVYVIGLT
jgi:hypothetical protein